MSKVRLLVQFRKQVSKVISDYIGFALLRSVIGPEKLPTHLANQMENKNESRRSRPHFPAP